MADNKSEKGLKESVVSQAAPGLLAFGLLFLALGAFIGNVAIAAGQVLVIFAVVIGLIQHKGFVSRFKQLPLSSWWLFAFAFFAVISVVANAQDIDRPLSFIKKTRYFLIYPSILLIPVVLWRALSWAWLRDGVILCWLIPLIPAFLVGLIGVIRLDHPFADLGPGKVERLSGLQGEVMTFAYGLQFTVIALSVFFFTPALWKSITRLSWRWVVLFTIIAGAAMYLTYSRGAVLGVVVGLAIFATMRSRYLMLGLVAVGIAGAILASTQEARYFNTNESVRGNQWKAATIAFIENPVSGLGFRNFEIHSVELKKRYGIQEDITEKVDGVEITRYFKGHAHNIYLEAFASIGVFGGLCLIGFCLSWVQEAWRSRYRELFVPLIAAFLVSGFFENTFYDSEVLNCILLIYVFSQVAIRHEKKSMENGEPESVKLPA